MKWLAEVKVAGWKGLKEAYSDSVGLRKLDREQALHRLNEVTRVLRDYKPEIVQEPSDEEPGLLKVEKKDTAIFVAVYSDSMVVLAKDITGVLDRVLEYKEERGLKALLIIYSRRGRLGPLCYLFLGGVIRDQEIGVLYINGSPREVYDVVREVLEKGEYVVREEDYIKLSEV